MPINIKKSLSTLEKCHTIKKKKIETNSQLKA